MGLSKSFKLRRLKGLIHRESKPVQERETTKSSSSSDLSSLFSSVPASSEISVPTATNVSEPQRIESNFGDNDSTATDDFFSEILHSQAGIDYISYVNSGFEAQDTVEAIPRTVPEVEIGVPGEQVWGVFDEKDLLEESALRERPFAEMISTIERQELFSSYTSGQVATEDFGGFGFNELPDEDSSEEDDKYSFCPFGDDTSSPEKKSRISRAVFSKIREFFMGNSNETEPITRVPEELDEEELNRPYNTIRFNPVIEVHFFDKYIAPAHIFPIEYSYQASLQTDQHQSRIFIDEQASYETVSSSQSHIKNSKKRAISEDSEIPRQAKRLCTPFSIPKRSALQPVLNKKTNPNFNTDAFRSKRAEGLTFEQFEEKLEIHRNKRMSGDDRREHKFDQVARHYQLMKQDLDSGKV